VAKADVEGRRIIIKYTVHTSIPFATSDICNKKEGSGRVKEKGKLGGGGKGGC